MGFVTPIEVRRIRSDEWERIKAIRLAALAESPTAFITTVGEALEHPDEFWIERATSGAAGDTQVTVLAVQGRRTVGMAIGLRRSKPPLDVVPVVSVFVEPAVRRLGVGGELMDGVEQWATSLGAATSSLWVVEENVRAQQFYEARGYTATVDRQKIRVPPERWERRYEKRLGGVPATR